MKTRTILAASITSLLLATASLHAANFTWDGGSAVDSNFSTAANWSPDGAPTSNLATTDLFFAGSTRLTPNVSAAFSANSVTFSAGAGGFGIGGLQLNVGAGGIVNNSTNAQSFSTLSLGSVATSTINAAAGNILIGSALAAPTGTLTVDGAFGTTFNGSITGTSALVKQGAGTMTWFQGTAVGYNVSVNAGTVSLNGFPSFSSTSTLAVNGTGALSLTVDTTINGGLLTRAVGATVGLAAGRTLSIQNGGDAVFTGAFTNSSASTITVTGAGSTLSNNGSSMTFNGGSTTNVLAGGTLSSTFGLNLATSGNATMTVDGAGSNVTTPGIAVAQSSGSTGTLNFTNGSTGSLGFTTLGGGVTTGTSGILNIQSGSAVTTNGLNIATGVGSVSGSLAISGPGSSLTMNGANTATIGAASGSTGLVQVQTSGTFSSGTGAITVNPTGTVTIGPSGIFNANGDMTVNGHLSRDTTGAFNLAAGKTLTVQNGGDFAITGFYVAAPNAIYNVTGSGSTMTTTASLSLNNGCTVNVTAGGVISSTSFVDVGNSTNGTVIVDGAGSSLSASGQSFIGANGGTGSLTLSNSAAATFQSAIVGNSGGAGTVTVQSGSTLTFTGNVNIATAVNSLSGTVTVTGAGSAINMGANGMAIGTAFGPTGVLNVNSGGTFTAGSLAVSPPGSVSVNGGTINLSGPVNISGGQLTTGTSSPFNLNAGSLSVLAAGNATFNTTPIFASGTTVAVTGPGSILRNGPGLGAGLAFNNVSLSISGGGAVSSDTVLNVGVGTSTVVTVDGTGSSLSGSSNFANNWGVGNGTPSITFSNGATGSFGLVKVADIGASNTTVGIASGAAVAMAGLTVASATTGATGTVNVGGLGSALTISTSKLAVGNNGSGPGTLNINSGGTVTTNSAGNVNNLVLNPTGTVNINGGALILGDPITRNGGVLNFNSGLLSLDESLTVGAGGLLGTNLTLASDRQLIVAAAQTTTVSPLNTLTISGGSLSTGALVNSGSIDFQKGTLAVTGSGGFNVGTGALGGNVSLGTGANLQVTNTTTVANGALLRTDGGTFSGLNITNDGTIDHRGGTFTFNGTMTNNAAGRVFVSGVASGTGPIINAGTITLQSGVGFLGGAGGIANNGLITGDGTIAKIVSNNAAGQIRAEAGKTLTFTNTFSPNAGTISLQGGTVEFTTGLANSSTGFISGNGALRSIGITNQGVMAFSGGNANIFGDVANLAGSRIITSGGTITTFFDDVVHNGTEIRTSAGASSVFFGAVSGAGPYTGTGTVYFEGDLRPGNSPASVSFGGDLVLGLGAKTTMEIGGTTQGTQYDHLNVDGTLFVDGTLEIVLLTTYMPRAGDTYDFVDAAAVSGQFSSVQLPTLDSGLAWDTSQLTTTGVVSVVSSVPEPGSATLALLGTAVLGLRRSRRR